MSNINLSKPFTYGRRSSIHKINDYQVIKLYSKDMPTERIEEEFNKTRLVWKSGKLDVPEPIKLTKVNGRDGIIFQRIDGISYMDIFQKKPWLFFSKIKEIANIQRKVHEQIIDGLPTQKEEFHNLISQSPRINEKEKKMLLKILSEKHTPVLCHGDFHHGNLIETKDKGTYIIDWMDAFSGSYQLDVALTAVNAIVSTSPDHVPAFYRNAYELLKRLIPLDKIYLRNYDKNFNQNDWNNYMWLASGIHLARCEEKDYKFHLKYSRNLEPLKCN
jgi:thiamine kinase-like enzyme